MFGAFAGVRRKWFRKKNDFSKYAWVVPVVLLFGIVTLWNRGAVQYPMTTMSARLSAMFQKAQHMNRGERIAFWSAALYKNPALLSVLAPGPKIPDTSPLFPNGYNCTTYVETVGALARSESGADLADKLISIRYRKGEISYMTRNHFPEADWIPNNERAGNLEDITKDVAKESGVVAKYAHKDIDKVTWFRQQDNVNASRAIASMSDETVPVDLAYVPLTSVKSVVGHVPQGTVINVVRMDMKRKPVLITHQGFLIWKNNVPYLRHASSFKEIKEVPLTQYLEGLKKMPWPVLGLNFNQYQ